MWKHRTQHGARGQQANGNPSVEGRTDTPGGASGALEGLPPSKMQVAN